MKISSTYRIIASLLSISILMGVLLPAGILANGHEVCDSMQNMHTSHHMDSQPAADQHECPMQDQHEMEMPPKMDHSSDSDMQDFGIACSCSFSDTPIKTEAPVVQNVKVKMLTVVQVLAENHTDEIKSENYAIPITDSYSPPPIFLANESFLI